LRIVLTADGRRWTQINTDKFFSLDDMSRERHAALRAKIKTPNKVTLLNESE
jgi:hypothetical protein